MNNEMTAQELWDGLSKAQRAFITLMTDIRLRPGVYEVIEKGGLDGLLMTHSIMENLEVVANADRLEDKTQGWLGREVYREINHFVENANIGEDRGTSLFGRLFSRGQRGYGGY